VKKATERKSYLLRIFSLIHLSTRQVLLNFNPFSVVILIWPASTHLDIIQQQLGIAWSRDHLWQAKRTKSLYSKEDVGAEGKSSAAEN